MVIRYVRLPPMVGRMKNLINSLGIGYNVMSHDLLVRADMLRCKCGRRSRGQVPVASPFGFVLLHYIYIYIYIYVP
jgi:hypothetical protein